MKDRRTHGTHTRRDSGIAHSTSLTSAHKAKATTGSGRRCGPHTCLNDSADRALCVHPQTTIYAPQLNDTDESAHRVFGLRRTVPTAMGLPWKQFYQTFLVAHSSLKTIPPSSQPPRIAPKTMVLGSIFPLLPLNSTIRKSDDRYSA